ncbi:hypothetical protein AGMMS49992_16960 [Clostridia bacterium]|nr:hypothetical protein AGMMS49992_16960 [Clostridia bacterium]
MSGKVKVLNGIDRPEVLDKLLRGARIGLATGGSAVDRYLTPCVDVLAARFNVTALFNTILGIRGEYRLGETTPFYTDAATGLPAYSIFSRQCAAPTEEMLSAVDIVVFDIKEAGVRFYEYLACAANVLKACAKAGKPMVVLDRAAPIGGEIVEGTVCPSAMHTVVGDYGLPTRTALTLGEFCRYVNGEFSVGCDLHVVKVEGWRRGLYYDETDLPWVLPSPSLPTTESNIIYAGMCIFEGIDNISEGRGTTQPFQLIGAPWMAGSEVAMRMRRRGLDGATFGPAYFKPTYGPFAHELCSGIQVHVSDRREYQSFRTALVLLEEIRALYGDKLIYRDTSAGHDVAEELSEPVFTKYLEKILAVPGYLDSGLSADALIDAHASGRAAYTHAKQKYHLYE